MDGLGEEEKENRHDDVKPRVIARLRASCFAVAADLLREQDAEAMIANSGRQNSRSIGRPKR